MRRALIRGMAERAGRLRPAGMLVLAGLAVVVLPPVGAKADPSALWKIVNGACVPHEQTAHDPDPCATVDLADGVERGYAVLKDLKGIAQFLLIPTARVSGIESPELLAPNAVNYFDAAWGARYFMEERLHTALPRDAVSLAINAATGRSQDQLHIHIDCIRPDVRDALAGGQQQIGRTWAPFPTPLAGHPYRAMRIDQDSLEGVDPFRLLADSDPETAANMGRHTLVVVGMTFADDTNGFILLDTQANILAGNLGSGEELQDHACAIAGR